MSKLITSVHDFPACSVKVYSHHERYDTNETVADSIVDLNNGVFRFGVVECYNGEANLEAFEEALNLFNLDDDFWYDSEYIDYAIVEIIDDHIDFYHLGDCEIFIKYDNKWFDLYDLILDVSKVLPSEHSNNILGHPEEFTLSHISEVILSTSSCGVTVDDLNDRISEEHTFMTSVSFDETNDLRLMHIKLGE